MLNRPSTRVRNPDSETYAKVIQSEYEPNNIVYRAAIWLQEWRPGGGPIEVISGLYCARKKEAQS